MSARPRTPAEQVRKQLRLARVRGRPVTVILRPPSDLPQVTGKVEEIAMTDAFVMIAGTHVPLEVIVEVRE